MSKIKRFFRRKSLLRNIIVGILIVVTVGAAVGGVVALTRNTDKIDEVLTYESIGWTKYSIGGLASNGAYMSTDQSIYTEKVFECQGLNVTPVFDSEVSYQIYFYDQNNEFVHTTGRLTGTFVQDSVPFFAKYARIVITPNDDNKVTIFELAKYAKQLEVKVYREQGFKNYTEDLFKWIEDFKLVDGVLTENAGQYAQIKTSEFVNLSSYKDGMYYREAPNSDYSLGCNLHCYSLDKAYIGKIVVRETLGDIFTSSEGVVYKNIQFSSLPEGTVFIRLSWQNVSSAPQLYCR